MFLGDEQILMLNEIHFTAQKIQIVLESMSQLTHMMVAMTTTPAITKGSSSQTHYPKETVTTLVSQMLSANNRVAQDLRNCLATLESMER